MNDNLRFFYAMSNSYNGNGGITFAYDCRKGSDKLIFSMAVCSMKDRFNKKIGRTIAAGRFKAGKVELITMDPNHDISELFRELDAVACDIADSAWLKSYPKELNSDDAPALNLNKLGIKRIPNDFYL